MWPKLWHRVWYNTHHDYLIWNNLCRHEKNAWSAQIIWAKFWSIQALKLKTIQNENWKYESLERWDYVLYILRKLRTNSSPSSLGLNVTSSYEKEWIKEEGHNLSKYFSLDLLHWNLEPKIGFGFPKVSLKFLVYSVTLW